MSDAPPISPSVSDTPACAPSLVALIRQARRLANLPQAPWLHEEAARRLAAKLAPIRLAPTQWIDWSAHLGAGGELVQAQYPQAQRWVLEPTEPLRQRSLATQAQRSERSWRTLWRREAPVVWSPADIGQAPWQPEGVQMLWANMTLHAHPDLPQLMSIWHRQLAVDGFLMCSGLGPDTARELREVYRELGWPLPTIDFIDMHDLGDDLVRAGFADPVMDMEKLILTWETPQALLQELQTWGGNVATGRYAGWRTPRWRERLLRVLGERLMRADGRLGLTIELVYGHAVKPAPRPKVAPETKVSLSDMRLMVRKADKP